MRSAPDIIKASLNYEQYNTRINKVSCGIMKVLPHVTFLIIALYCIKYTHALVRSAPGIIKASLNYKHYNTRINKVSYGIMKVLPHVTFLMIALYCI